MYRTASYFKNSCLERLEVNVYEDEDCKYMLLQIHVDFKRELIHAITIFPRSCKGFSLNVQFDEIRRLNNFLDRPGWRKKCVSYHILTSDRL